MKKYYYNILFSIFLFYKIGSTQELIIQPPVIPPFGCTEFYNLFTGSVTNFSKNTFSTFLYGEVNYTNPSGQTAKLAELIFRGMPSIDFGPGVVVIGSTNYTAIYPNRKLTFFDRN